MGKPYSDIEEAERLMQEFTNLQDWRKNKNTTGYSGVGTQGRRGNTSPAYVIPFSFDIDPSTVVPYNQAPASYTALQTHINAAANGKITDASGGDTVQAVTGFTPAKIVWFRNTTYSTQPATSKYTKRVYLKYNGDRDTCAFGRSTDTSAVDEKDVFDQIKAILMALSGYDNGFNRVSWMREKLRL